MRVLYEQAPFSIVRYAGRIEAVTAAKQFGDGALIAYLRIAEEGAGAKVLQNFPVGNTVRSYLHEGSDCTLYAVQWQGGALLPFAIAVDGRKVYDPLETERLAKAMVQQVKLMWGSVALFGLLMCILVIFIYFGVPILVYALWRLKKGLERTKLPLAAMSQALREEGWELS